MKEISRRELLRRGVLASVSLGLFGSSVRSWASPTEFVPALVIGSGYGGAVAALRLAEAGIHTVVLERGRRWPITPAQDTFATFENPDGRAAWLSDHTVWPVLPPAPIDVFTGNFERIEANGITVFTGAGVGGGSLVNNAILLQPRRKLFERVFPKAIDFDEMDELYYPRVRDVIEPEPIPEDVLIHPSMNQRASTSSSMSGQDSQRGSSTWPSIGILCVKRSREPKDRRLSMANRGVV